LVVGVVNLSATAAILAGVGTAGVVGALAVLTGISLLANAFVGSWRVHAVTSITTWIQAALIYVDLAVGPIEAFVAFTAKVGPIGNALAIVATGPVSTVIDLCAVRPLPSHGAGARVLGQGLEAAGPPVAAGAVCAGVVGHGDLTERCLIPNGARALEGGPPGGRHDHAASASILALLAASVAGILVLAIFSGESRWTVATGAAKRILDALSSIFTRIGRTRDKAFCRSRNRGQYENGC
jgi:hypothetical protein